MQFYQSTSSPQMNNLYWLLFLRENGERIYWLLLRHNLLTSNIIIALFSKHNILFFFCTFIFDSFWFTQFFYLHCYFWHLLILALACLVTLQLFVLHFQLWYVLIPTVSSDSHCWLSSNCIVHARMQFDQSTSSPQMNNLYWLLFMRENGERIYWLLLRHNLLTSNMIIALFSKHNILFFFCTFIFDSFWFTQFFFLHCYFWHLLILALACLVTLQLFVLHFQLWYVLIPTVSSDSHCWLSSNCIFLYSCGRISSNHTFLCSSFSFWFVLVVVHLLTTYFSVLHFHFGPSLSNFL